MKYLKSSYLFLSLGIFFLLVRGAGCEEGQVRRVIHLEDGVDFRMGTIVGKRLVHPKMGAKRLTFNYAESRPGDEFPQHVHDSSDDTFLVLEGEADVRQGDSLRRLPAGHAAFVPSGEIHGTITRGTGKAFLISFQCPPDLRLYTGARDSSRAGAEPPKGVITPGAVRLIEFGNKDGFFVHPGMGSERVAVAHRRLEPGGWFPAELPASGEGMLFVWKGSVSVEHASRTYPVPERSLFFAVDSGKVTVVNSTSQPAVVIQIQSPPGSAR